MTIARTPGAVADALDIWDYVSEHDEAAADALLDLFDAKLLLLERHPRVGRARDELGPGLRSFTAGSYVLFYRPLADGVELTRILRASRDLGRSF